MNAQFGRDEIEKTHVEFNTSEKEADERQKKYTNTNVCSAPLYELTLARIIGLLSMTSQILLNSPSTNLPHIVKHNGLKFQNQIATENY